jgi:hypothetical protein
MRNKKRSLDISIAMIGSIAIIAFVLVYFVIDSASNKKPPTPETEEVKVPKNIGYRVEISPSTSSPIKMDDTSKNEVRLGEYVLFAKYDGEPILWRVIDIRKKRGEMTLWSDRILTFKAFDANGDFHKDEDRMKFGSNYYRDSNLRQWLNSNETEIDWLQNRPIKEQLEEGKNPYNDEPGFLSDANFSDYDRSLIVPRKHEVLLAKTDIAKKEGGKEEHLLNTKFEKIMMNYDLSWYETLEDKVFLLSIRDLTKFIYDRSPILGEDYYKTTPTEKAIATRKMDESQDVSADKYWHYWLRTPETSNAINVRAVNNLGYVYSESAYDGSKGVRPGIMMDLKKAVFKSGGKGTIKKPFVIVNPNADE